MYHPSGTLPRDPRWKTLEYPFWSDREIPPSTIQYAPVTPVRTLVETTRDGRRWYVDAENTAAVYPSITTVLSASDTEGRHALIQWRARVGAAAAQTITETSANYGSKWHNFCEQYLTGQPVTPELTKSDLPMATAIAKVLNTHVRTVLLSEARVSSSRLQVAGRIDVCAELNDGRVAVLDFKTGKKPKQGNRLSNYALQATFYAEALSECLQRPPITDIVVVQLCPFLLLWQESTTPAWQSILEDRIVTFRAQFS